MAYTDAQGRPEIVMHPDIVRGASTYRITAEPNEDTNGDDAAPATAESSAANGAGAPTR